MWPLYNYHTSSCSLPYELDILYHISTHVVWSLPPFFKWVHKLPSWANFLLFNQFGRDWIMPSCFSIFQFTCCHLYVYILKLNTEINLTASPCWCGRKTWFFPAILVCSKNKSKATWQKDINNTSNYVIVFQNKHYKSMKGGWTCMEKFNNWRFKSNYDSGF